MSNIIKFGGFQFNPQTRELSSLRHSVQLSPKAAAVLVELLTAAGKTVTKTALLAAVWPDEDVQESSLTQNIHILRTALRAGALDGAIQTMPGVGYRMLVSIDTAHRKLRVGRIASALAVCAVLSVSMLISLPRSERSGAFAGEAARLYGLGRFYWNLRTPAGFQRSLYYLKAAHRLNPSSTRVTAALADTYTEIADYTCVDQRPCPQIERQARQYAKLALHQDPDSSQAHASYAQTLRVLDRDYQASDNEFRRALLIDPRNAIARAWYGFSLLRRGRLAPARAQLQEAADIDPVATATNAALAEDSYFEHRYRDAITYGTDALHLNPRRAETWIILALSYEQLGRLSAAEAALETAGESGWSNSDVRVMRATLDALQGRRADARVVLRNRPNVCGEEMALLYASLERFAEAQRSLRCMKPTGDPFAYERQYDPRLIGRAWATSFLKRGPRA